MNEAKNIVLTSGERERRLLAEGEGVREGAGVAASAGEGAGEGEVLRLTAGVYHAEPLLVEVGCQSVRVVLDAGAVLHASAFVLAVGGDVGWDEAGSEICRVEGDRAEGGVDVAARLAIEVDLAGEGAEFHLHGLFIASGMGASAGRTDIKVIVRHLAPGCVSRQLVKGIAAGSATGSFDGLIHVARGAQLSDATQRSQNLQLADTAHVYARPQLEIYADDVRCSHGATVGRLDEEAVYYMRQRGVPEAEARRLQLHGFAGEIVDKGLCFSGDFREFFAAKIGGVIDRI